MDIMNQVKESLNRNSNISDSVKENLMELINIFHEKFSDDYSGLSSRTRS